MNKVLAKDFFSCKNISIDLGGREILRNININIKPGEVLGIIGPNGAGKTSLIEILSGRYKQKTGDVIYKDQIINSKPLYERARMGIGRTYQTPVVPEELTVGETLKAARQANKPYLPITDAEYAADLVKFTVDWDVENTKLETFNRRKLLMTSILMREPDIILMDEWIGVGDSSFLDQATKRLETFIDQSSILVLASHSEDLIRSTCNKAILLGQGHILAQGSVDEVFNHYNFFGSNSFFDMEEYVNLHPDLKKSMDIPGMAPWMHFIKYGIFEGRSPGFGIRLEAFKDDKVFNHAINIGDGLSAAERIEQIAPFLKSFEAPANWNTKNNMPYPSDFIATEGYPLVQPESLK